MRLTNLALSLTIHAGAAAGILLLTLSSADPPPVVAAPQVGTATIGVVRLLPAGGAVRGGGVARTRRPPRARPRFAAPTEEPAVLSAGSEDAAASDNAAVEGDEPLGDAGAPTGEGSGIPVAAPTPPAPVRVGGGIRPPVKLRSVDPAYPALAQIARIEGTVILDCIIAADGRVVDVRILAGPPLLSTAAAEAVEQWLYRPTLLDGVAVPVIMRVTVRFRLSR